MEEKTKQGGLNVFALLSIRRKFEATVARERRQFGCSWLFLLQSTFQVPRLCLNHTEVKRVTQPIQNSLN
ncbi:hypothetical protein CapIbe_015891 [Capra ibex]